MSWFTKSLTNIGSASAILGGAGLNRGANSMMNAGGAIKGQYNTARKAGFGRGVSSGYAGVEAGRQIRNTGAVGMGALGGAGYGAMSDDTSMAGGAFMGARAGYAGRRLKNAIY